MAAKVKKSEIKKEVPSNTVEVIPGNTGVLTVQALAAISRQLAKIILLLEKK